MWASIEEFRQSFSIGVWSIPKDSVNDITCSPKCRPSVMVVRASPYALSTIIILTLISIANRNNQQHTSIHEAATSFFMYLSSSPLIVSIIMWNTKSIPITIDRCVERFWSLWISLRNSSSWPDQLHSSFHCPCHFCHSPDHYHSRHSPVIAIPPTTTIASIAIPGPYPLSNSPFLQVNFK